MAESAGEWCAEARLLEVSERLQREKLRMTTFNVDLDVIDRLSALGWSSATFSSGSPSKRDGRADARAAPCGVGASGAVTQGTTASGRYLTKRRAMLLPCSSPPR